LAEAEGRIWNDAPSVLIFADDAGMAVRAAELATGLGARVIGTGGLAQALPRLTHQVAIDAVVLELDQWSGAAPALLSWAEDAAETGFAVPIICFPPALLDAVAAHVASPAAELLCAPEPEERIAALAIALAERGQRLHDHGVEASAERLRRLSQEVARIATALTELSSTTRPPIHCPVAVVEAADAPRIEPNTVRALIRLRRLRAQFFADHLFADPAWDMLLDLMAARLEQERVAVSSLCIAAAVPPTTALRWIRTMTEQGLFVRRQDPGDGRRIFIELSDSAAASMAAYLRQAQTLGWRPA
jgi:DNA-binding MarR family transcriptional regulator